MSQPQNHRIGVEYELAMQCFMKYVSLHLSFSNIFILGTEDLG